ncbi:diguanylate cyclase [Bacillota bacterium LX-D]|nr:diguanylate cyclase [Bacillota bacterium LX-D]
MLSDLVINAAILVAFVCIENQIFRDTELDLNSPILLKALVGVICGILGILLMIYCVKVDKTIIIDFRNIAIIMAGMLGGTVSIAVSALMIGLFRIFHYGINTSSITALIVAVLVGIGISIIFRKKVSMPRKWFYSISYCLIISSIALSILLWKDNIKILHTLCLYIVGTIVAALIVYKYMEYLQGITKLFKTLKEESAKDYLTGLNNVRQFDRLFNQMAEELTYGNEPISLLFIDIDFFKKVNDTYGHKEGDRVLKELGKILIQTCRACDIVSRNGGEEFSVILKDCSVEEAVEIAERIRHTVEEHDFILSNGKVIHISISIGISTYPETVKKFSEIMEQADTALYKAKGAGRNKVFLH